MVLGLQCICPGLLSAAHDVSDWLARSAWVLCCNCHLLVCVLSWVLSVVCRPVVAARGCSWCWLVVLYVCSARLNWYEPEVAPWALQHRARYHRLCVRCSTHCSSRWPLACLLSCPCVVCFCFVCASFCSARLTLLARCWSNPTCHTTPLPNLPRSTMPRPTMPQPNLAHVPYHARRLALPMPHGLMSHPHLSACGIRMDVSLRVSPEALLGRQLRIYWTLDDAWFAGSVEAWDPTRGQHKVG